MHFVSKLSAAVCLTLLLSGCWSRVEINDRLFITALFVDAAEKEDEIELTLGFPLPNRLASSKQGTGGSQGGNPYGTITKTGKSIAIAYRDIQTDLSRQISWGHTRVIVVGKRMAERGIRPILEFVARQPAFHTKTFVLLAPKEAKEIAKLPPVSEQFPSEVLRELCNRRNILCPTVRDLMMNEPYSGDALIGHLTVKEGPLISEKMKTSIWVQTDGAGVIQNGKRIGLFDMLEMRSGMWIQGRMEDALISIPSPADGKTISFMVVDTTTKIKQKRTGNGIQFIVSIRANDDIVASDSDIDLQNPEQIQQVQSQLRKVLKERIEKTLEKSQLMGADVFSFGRRIEWYYPKLWESWRDDWRKHYREDVSFVVVPEIYVKRPGGETSPFWKSVID